VEETASVLFGQLERLDRVVHDFMACMQQDRKAVVEREESEGEARLRGMLDRTSTGNGPVLGPSVLVGASPAIGIESVLGFVGALRKTGILRVQAGRASYMISIVHGDVVHGVCSPQPKEELLGSLLLARGAIESDAILRFFETCGSSTSRIVEALNREELVCTRVLREVLEQQMQRLFDRLLAAESAEWCFHEGEATLCYVNLRVNVNRMLLESARCQDEAGAPAEPLSEPAPSPESKPLELVWPKGRNERGRRQRRRYGS
jgi:hypothetical protein